MLTAVQQPAGGKLCFEEGCSLAGWSAVQASFFKIHTPAFLQTLYKSNIVWPSRKRQILHVHTMANLSFPRPVQGACARTSRAADVAAATCLCTFLASLQRCITCSACRACSEGM